MKESDEDGGDRSPYGLPTERQLEYARVLGLEVPHGATRGRVSQLIRVEERKRGREFCRRFRPKVGDVIDHPKYGVCEIINIGRPSMKITLLVADTEDKKVVSAASLSVCFAE